MIAEAAIPQPVEYLPTGDHALLMAWVQDGGDVLSTVLCLEDGRAVSALITEIKFDFRWSEARQQFVDVSGTPVDDGDAADGEEDEEGADTDQASPDDGGQGVPGPVSEAD